MTFEGLKPIGVDSAFCGVYDGKGYVIDSLYQSLGNSTNTGLALFSQLSGATIKNVIITNATAVLAAVATNATIYNCKITGNVIGKIDVTGGLIGILSGGNLEKSSSTAPVYGVMNSGGLVGTVGTGSVISNCFHKNDVSGNYPVGGLFGIIGSKVTIRYCYNAGVTLDKDDKSILGQYFSNDTTSTIVESIHWDATLARLNKSWQTGNPGSSTSEMYQQATFTGWDFDTIWTIAEGIDYPQLRYDNRVISILSDKHSPTNIPMKFYHQDNRIEVSGIKDCLITIVNFQGQVCLREKAGKLTLRDLPNGHYIAFVQSAIKKPYSLHQNVLSFTISN